jgi:hypothetical protein
MAGSGQIALALLTLLVAAGTATAASGKEVIVLKPVGCEVALYLAGQLVDTVGSGAEREIALPLAEGANVVALAVRAERSPAALEVRWKGLQNFPDGAGPWLFGLPAGAEWMQQVEPPKGFAPARRRGACFVLPAGQSGLRQVLYVPENGPRWFPKLDRGFVVAGTRQLLKPYLPPLGLPLAYDYHLCLALPPGIRALCCDGGVGAKPQSLSTVASAGGQLAQLDYRQPPPTPFGIYLCWQDANRTTLSYQLVLGIGGTHDWQRLQAKVRVPQQAAFVRPIVLKWAQDKVVGEAWLDNIALIKDGQTKNLLAAGNFEGEEWAGQSGLVQAGPDGSRCLHVVLRAEDGTRGWWVPKDTPLEVEGGKRYVVQADVKAEGVHVPGAAPHAAVLVACDRDTLPGERRMVLLGWSSQAGARTVPVQTTVQVLPPLKNKRPRALRIMPCYYSDPFEREEVIAAYADNAYASGITWTYGDGGCALAKRLLPRGHRVVCAYGRQPFEVSGAQQAYLKEHPELQAVRFDGTRLPTTACPTWFLSEAGRAAQAALRQEVQARLDTGQYAGFNWDIEQPVVEPPNFCVCARCLEAFRQFAGLEGPDLKPQALLAQPLRTQWVRFRCSQNARLVEMVRRWVKEYRPGIEFSVYSGYHNVFTREHYGVDWELLAPVLDAGMSGYGFSAKDEQATREVLGGKPYLAGELYCLSPTSHAGPPPEPYTWANRLLRQLAFTGGHGVVIWYLPVFDGAVFYQTSVAAEIAAQYEEFFRHGQRREGDFAVEGLKDNEWFALGLGDRVLLMVLNFEGEPLSAIIESNLWQAPGKITVEPFGRYVSLVSKK